MDSVTQTIVNYIEQTDVTNREDLLSVARIAFLDYLASLAPAETEQAVQDLARFIGTNGENVSKADKALYYGFASHYLDFDDAQAKYCLIFCFTSRARADGYMARIPSGLYHRSRVRGDYWFPY